MASKRSVTAARLSPNPAEGSNGLTSLGSATDKSVAIHGLAPLVYPPTRGAEEIEFERAVVTFFMDAAELLGVPRSVAAIYGVCFASAEPLGFTELAERLQISAGSISQGLKLLREVGALKVVSLPLERRDRFEPDLELRKLISHFIEQRLHRQLESGHESLKVVASKVPPTHAKLLRARIKALQTWHEKARMALPVIKTLLKLT